MSEQLFNGLSNSFGVPQDMLLEFQRVARVTQAELEAKRAAQKCLSSYDATVLKAIEKRLAAVERDEKNELYTVDQLLAYLNARLFKPQRLVSLTYEEEERRCLRGWWRFDWKLNLACFRPIDELGELVRQPELFRETVRELIIYMNDQIPMWLKLKPGKQVYAEFETGGGKYEVNLGSLSGGGSQSSAAMLRDDDEDEIQEGMTQLRGEASKDQDKFRITVEREQMCCGFCDDTAEPHFQPGTTSVTFTGAHFRMSNVKWPEEVWLKTEVFYVDGKQVVHKAGDPVPENLAKSMREIRRAAPEFWSLLEKLGFQFYQQPSGMGM